MMPALGLIAIPGPRWLPPIPLPLFLLWPFVPLCLGTARLLDGGRPADAARLRIAAHVFLELRGLSIDVDTADGMHVRIRFV
jgi:hypothetical protein